tara:strand:+ start:396 stop:647 length:252 start_codon:yes stop_codon:yes gene_type:complete
MKWKELVFKSHPYIKGAIQCTMDFPNGYTISIVGGGRGLYGDGIKSFEIWSTITEKSHDGVKGYQTKRQVLSHINTLMKKEKI